MALIVRVFVNEREVAIGTARNVAGENVCDYDVRVLTEASVLTGPRQTTMGRVTDHDRRQSPWALVEKIARAALEQDQRP